MIYYVTGPLGAGKSFYVIRKVGKALLEGKAVAGNIRLVDDFAEILAKRNPYCKFSAVNRRHYAKELRTRYHYEDDIELLTHLRLKGKGEGRGLLVLDEAHNEMNNLDYFQSHQKDTLEWITLSRKLGWHVYIVSQHAGNTMAGLRRIATVQIRMVNWKQVTKMPLLDMALFPFPVFLATARPNKEAFEDTGVGRRKKRPLFREFFLLSWHKRLYATDQLFGDIADDPLAHYLPSEPEEREAVKLEWIELMKLRAEAEKLAPTKEETPTAAGVSLLRPPSSPARRRRRA